MGRGAKGTVLTEQVLVRMEPDLHQALAADAKAHGRTITQTIRHLLTHSPAIADRLDASASPSV